MRIAFVETASLTNDLLRAVAGAHPLCVGYPDGVPESWADVSACAADATEAPVEWHKTRGKHPICETFGGAGGGAAFPDHELDPAALLGPVVEPVDWPDERGDDEC